MKKKIIFRKYGSYLRLTKGKSTQFEYRNTLFRIRTVLNQTSMKSFVELTSSHVNRISIRWFDWFQYKFSYYWGLLGVLIVIIFIKKHFFNLFYFFLLFSFLNILFHFSNVQAFRVWVITTKRLNFEFSKGLFIRFVEHFQNVNKQWRYDW